MNENYDCLVLSGGSMNGIGMLGALQYLKDQNKLNFLKHYVGVSVGAIICYLLIIGYTPVEIIVYLCTHKHVFEKMKNFDYLQALRGDGAISFSYIIDVLEQMTVEKIGKILLLRDLKSMFDVSFSCVTFNVTKSHYEVISDTANPDLPCITALRMTSNIPFVFEPYKFSDSYYLDGGITNNFPIDIGESLGNKVIAISIQSPTYLDLDKKDFFEYLNKVLLILINEACSWRLKYKKDTTDVIAIESGDKAIKMYEFNIDSKTKLDFFSFGYDWAKTYYTK